MKEIELIEQKVELFNCICNRFVLDLKEFFVNTSVPLDKRWQIYLDNLDILPISYNYIQLDEFKKYDFDYYHFSCEAPYETVYFNRLIRDIERNKKVKYNNCNFLNDKDKLEYEKLEKISVDKLKEDILKTGFQGYINSDR